MSALGNVKHARLLVIYLFCAPDRFVGSSVCVKVVAESVIKVLRADLHDVVRGCREVLSAEFIFKSVHLGAYNDDLKSRVFLSF